MYFDAVEYAMIKQEARRQNIPFAQLVRRATKEYMERHKKNTKKTFDELPNIQWKKPPQKDMAKNVDKHLYKDQ